MREFEFTSRITGAPYASLVRELSIGADRVGFIIRPSVVVSDEAKKLIADLSEEVLADTEKDRWPGTILFGHQARVIELRPSATVFDRLLAASNGFWDWMQPALPEDLFIIKKEIAILTTIAHEHFGLIRIESPTATMAHLIERGKMLLRKRKNPPVNQNS